MLTVAIPKRNKLQNIIVLTPKDGFLTILPDVLGVKGVWLAVPAAELGAMAVSVFCLFEGQRAFCLKTGQQ